MGMLHNSIIIIIRTIIIITIELCGYYDSLFVFANPF